MEWTIDNILNKDNKITWLFDECGVELVTEGKEKKYILKGKNKTNFDDYIDSLDITESDKKKLKTGTIIPQRTHVGDKQDDLLNKVGDVLREVSKALNEQGDGKVYYNIPKTLEKSLRSLTDLRTNDKNDYHTLLINCNTVSDTNQLLYAQAVNDLKNAFKQTENCRKTCGQYRAILMPLAYLRHVTKEVLGSTGRRLCYCFDMDVVEQLRTRDSETAQKKNKGGGNGEDKLETVLKKCDALVKDAYEEFDKWLAYIIEQEKAAYYEKIPQAHT